MEARGRARGDGTLVLLCFSPSVTQVIFPHNSLARLNHTSPPNYKRAWKLVFHVPKRREAMSVNTSHVYHKLQVSKQPTQSSGPYLMEISNLLTKKEWLSDR